MKKKGFTLVELLAVIVILAIIALIAVPIVLKLIDNSEVQAEKQSIIGYVRVVEDYIHNDMMKNPGRSYSYYNNNIPDNLDYKGNKVTCSKIEVDQNGKVELSCCKVEKGTGTGYDYKNKKVEKSTDPSCNANDNNNQENNGNNNNNKTFEIGEEVTLTNHGNEKYNVIGQGEDYVTLLKQEPLTVDEANTYGGVGTENNHVNKNTYAAIGTACDIGDSNHTGGLVYYSSPTCGYTPGIYGSWYNSGCESEDATNYNNSDVKYVVDAWALDKFANSELKTVDGYSARLVQKEELRMQFYPSCSSTAPGCKDSATPSWIWSSNYAYWTMSQYDCSSSWVMSQDNSSSTYMWGVDRNGILDYLAIDYWGGAIRPVINIYKSKL